MGLAAALPFISAGTGIASLFGGKNDSPSTEDIMATASPYETAQADIAKQLFSESTPVRNTFTNQLENFMGGNYELSNLPAYKPMYDTSRRALENQYSTAKSQLLSNLPAGGATISGLGKLEQSRASDVGALPSQISSGLVQDLLTKAYGVAYQTPSTAMTGLGSAASGYNSRYGTTAMSNLQSSLNTQSAWNRLGSGLGYSLGSGDTSSLFSGKKGTGSNWSNSFSGVDSSKFI